MKKRILSLARSQLADEWQRIESGWKRGLKRKHAGQRILPSVLIYGVGLLVTFSAGWLTGVGFAIAGGLAIAHGTILLRDDVIVGVLIAAIIGLVMGPIKQGAFASFGDQDWIGLIVMFGLGVYVFIMQREARTGKEFSITEFLGQRTGERRNPRKPRSRSKN